MIRFRQLEAFRCLMIAGTSVGAARRMHVTQPAISRLIADLEEDLGFRLFNRTKGRLEPTVAGVRFFNAVEENFLGLERLKQEAAKIRESASEGLTVACLPVIASSVLPLILKEFFLRHPDVPVEVDSRTVPEIMVSLQDLKADVALSLAFPSIAGIEVEPLLTARQLCAVPVGHRLAALDVVTPEDLQGEAMIGWLPNKAQTYAAEQGSLQDAGVAPRFMVKTHTSHTRYAMVAHGLGVSIVEPFAASIWQAHGVVLRPFETELRLEYVLACPSNGLRSELVQDFREAVFKVMRNYDFGVGAEVLCN
jgi:DNA-binding transcriptional LysR family regulator